MSSCAATSRSDESTAESGTSISTSWASSVGGQSSSGAVAASWTIALLDKLFSSAETARIEISKRAKKKSLVMMIFLLLVLFSKLEVGGGWSDE